MSDPKAQDQFEDLEKALKDADHADQGDIAADDAGGTALAERVAKSTAVQGDDEADD
jgi:hypothetical protein